MKTPENDLKQLKQQPMWKVVKARVPSLTKEGQEYQCCCPFHADDTPSFKLYREGQVWLGHCFGCGLTLNAIQFIEKFDKISFGDAVKKAIAEFAWEAGKETVESTFTEAIDEEKKKITYPLTELLPWEMALDASVEAQAWLANRGIQWDGVEMHLGYVQNLSYISPNHPWVNNGWIAFPTVDGDTVTSIKFRSLCGKKTPDGKKSGILRAPDMVTTLYNLGAITPFDDCWVVEGEPDTVVMMQAGYPTTGLPTDKYVMSSSERDTLLRANRIFLAGDMDQVGRDAMKKLWGELRDRVYMIEWPEGMKDANQTFLEVCQGNVEEFQALLEKLKSKALETPIPDYYDVRESLRNSDDTKPIDNPQRLHARDRAVDEMAITLPGNVVSMFATYTGSGKTSWILDMFELEEAMNWGSVVLNYSAELSPEEFARLVAANLLEKDRLALTKEDFKEAARLLDKKEAKFYVGYNPELNRIGLVLDSIEWAIRRLGARIVVLDHFHFLCRGERDDIKAQSDAMQRIKNIARKYGVIFIVVGQSRKAQPGRKGPSAASDAKGSECLAMGTRVLTPTGFRSIESLAYGDFIIGVNGKQTRVCKLIPPDKRQCYRVTFSDGASVECDASHLWTVRSPNTKKRGQPWVVKTTRELMDGGLTWKAYNGYSRWKYHIPMVAPVEYASSVQLPLDPYLLGSLLGDGTLVGGFPQFTSADPESLDRIKPLLPAMVSLKKAGKYTWRITGKKGNKTGNPLKQALEKLGVWGHKADTKFVPQMYLTAGIDARLELLRGLLDTDGWCVDSKIRFGTVSKQLALDVQTLVQSLGGLAEIRYYDIPAHGNFVPHVAVIWMPHFNPFHLARKTNKNQRIKTRNRSIISITPTAVKEVRCVGVEADDSMFVIENFVVTHNSFISDASTTYHLHRSLRTGIDLDRPETWPFDILDNITDIRLDKCRTKGPGKAVARQIFDGRFGKFKPFTVQKQETANVGI